MAIEKINIERFLHLGKHYPILDVRSPAEYKHAHIPGAHSLPLFDDEERKVVGTTYKQDSRENAIKIGLDYFGPKMKLIVEHVEKILQTSTAPNSPNGASKIILVHCWRGGMRSGAIAWLLDIYGFKTYTLTGGYKNFRKHVLDTFKLPFNLMILGGYAGSGKTELLHELEKKGERVIDLENLANHKGSAFGNIGLPPQPGQEMFENLLALRLLEKIGITSLNDSLTTKSMTTPIWLEDESQRIGLVNLPNDLWNRMRTAMVYFLDVSFEERLQHIVREYGVLDQERLIAAIDRIREKLGGQNAKAAIQLLEEGNSVESFRILLKYYDKFYLKGLHNRKDLNSLLHTIESKSITSENADLLVQASRYISQKV